MCLTSRYSVTISLFISLTPAGLFPQLMVWVEGTSAAVAAQNRTCCCGTETGFCCGLGCCTARAPSSGKIPYPCPSRDSNRDGRICPLAMVAATDLASVGDGQRSLRGHLASNNDFTLADTTLQARHVRIDA